MPIQYSTRRKNQWLAGILLTTGALNFIIYGVQLGYYGLDALGKHTGLIITGTITTLLGLRCLYLAKTQPDRIITLSLMTTSTNPHTELPT